MMSRRTPPPAGLRRRWRPNLKLPALAEQLAQALEQAETDKPSYTLFLHDLLAFEIAATEQRRLDGRMRFVDEKSNVLLIGPHPRTPSRR